MSNAVLGRLIWVLIYGGLLAAVLGLVMQKTDPSLGWPIAIAGVLAAAIGVVLLLIRAGRKDAP